MNIPQLPPGLPDWVLPAAGLTLVAALAGIGYLAGNRARGNNQPDTSPASAGTGTASGADPAEAAALRRWRAASMLLTVAAAGVATAMSLNGMWQVFGDALHLDGPGRIALVGFLEIALLGSAIRARLALLETGRVGADGAAVWVLAIVSAALSAADATGLARPLRFVPPLLAAWMWERGLAADRRHATRPTTDGQTAAGWQPIAWRWTPHRLAVRLHLADPTHRTSSDVDRARRLAALTRARLRLAVLETTDVPRPVALLTARPIRVAYRTWRLQRHALAAVEHLHLGTDPTIPATITTTVAAVTGLRAATAPTALTSASPWTQTRTPDPSIGSPDRPIGSSALSTGSPDRPIGSSALSTGSPDRSIGSPDRSVGSTPTAEPIAVSDRHPIPTPDPIAGPDRIHLGPPTVNGSHPDATDDEHTPDRIVTTPTRRRPGEARRSARLEDVTRVQQAIATGQLPAEPTAEVIRRHLGISPAYARAARDAVALSASARRPGTKAAHLQPQAAKPQASEPKKASPGIDVTSAEEQLPQDLHRNTEERPQTNGTRAVALP